MTPYYILIYSFLILGSYSLGYGLIRIGFPLIQKRNLFEKIAIGYIGGIILFGLPFFIIDSFTLNEIYYALFSLIILLALILILFLKRTILNEEDPLIEKEILKPINSNYTQTKEDYSKLIKEDNQKEKSKEIKFNQGLMVKSRNKKEQVFKEENKDINYKNNSPLGVQKESIMSKLREYAQEVKGDLKETKKKKEEDEIEEDEELMQLIEDD
ncbi:MAG: hypothetical protein PHY04_01880 [Candidatus ainarchaeum sp.]|jgi:hypothetical protein|nr:hypothetical protein [Candidatus ainarchaeum sp.]MDD3085797.1 hypothetical protein [Candidatus ainarchaeum sp.]MDD4128462.1 hypothetical protein [Candidatus ainarchaeum sp.]MDD4468297.1 hypothetical protein [Candidatus ainarchaeum sp.]